MSSRSGSHAGRGFRYQDAIAAWLSARSWNNAIPWGLVIPEGGDDVELRGEVSAFVQVKSRRDHLGTFPASDVARFIDELWERHDQASVQPAVLWLVLERPFAGAAEPDGLELGVPNDIAALLPSDARAKSLIAKTRIMVVGSPQEAAISEIVSKCACTPLAAQLGYAEIIARVAKLSDDNGVEQPPDYEGLSRSDTETAISDLLGAIDPAVLEQAIAEGICEPVDFLTPIGDPNFYLGVDVEPGHLAAGLVQERPAPREQLARALEGRGNALVVGPSGAGKSAVMWDTARATRHVVRWFRVRRSSAAEVISLRRLAKTFRASPRSPVGFVFDDVGRLGEEGWSQLSRETPAQSGVVLLASVREEDAFILTERARAEEVRLDPEQADDGLAERMWRALRDAGATKWEGWSEPWTRSNGLLLEYAFILTQGERMAAVLEQQVTARIADASRDDELKILRVAACAGAAGARVEISRLSSVLGIVESSVARALHRLIAEHVLAEPTPGQLSSLHQLRSEGLLRASHKVPPPLIADTIARTVRVVVGDDLEQLVSHALARMGVDPSIVFAAATQRLKESNDAKELAALLRGFSAANIELVAAEWLQSAEAKALPPTQLTLAARFGVTGMDLAALGVVPKVTAAADALTKAMGTANAGSRSDFLAQLPLGLLDSLVKDAKSVLDTERTISALAGISIPSELRSALASSPPNFESDDLRDLAALLGTVTFVDRSLALEWVTPSVEERLLNRIAAEWPWVTAAELRDENGERVAAADYWYVAQMHQPNVHDHVVELCRILLCLFPRAELAASSAIAVNGEIVGMANMPPMASKRIPRKNLPPPVAPDWNWRWVRAIAARIAAPSYSDYLSRAVAILDELVPILDSVFDKWLRGKQPLPEQLTKLGQLFEQAQFLTPPTAAAQSAAGVIQADVNASVTRFQNILHNCSTDLIRRFIELPAGVGAFVAWSGDIIRDIDLVASEEPWSMLGASAPDSLSALKSIVETLHLLAGEASARNQAPHVTWRTMAKAAPMKKVLKTITARATTATEKRLSDARANLIAGASVIDPGIIIHVRDDPTAILPWPPIEVLALVSADDVGQGMVKLSQAMLLLRELAEPGRRLTIVPVVQGKATPDLAMSGVDTLLPSFGYANEWIEAVGTPVLKAPASDAFNHATAFAGELASLDLLGLATAERPEGERTVRDTLEEKLATKLADFESATAQFDPELRAAAFELVEQIRIGEVNLGAAAQAHLSGTSGEEVQGLSILVALLVQATLTYRF